jgi:hypothetical protein
MGMCLGAPQQHPKEMELVWPLDKMVKPKTKKAVSAKSSGQKRNKST